MSTGRSYLRIQQCCGVNYYKMIIFIVSWNSVRLFFFKGKRSRAEQISSGGAELLSGPEKYYAALKRVKRPEKRIARSVACFI